MAEQVKGRKEKPYEEMVTQIFVSVKNKTILKEANGTDPDAIKAAKAIIKKEIEKYINK